MLLMHAWIVSFLSAAPSAAAAVPPAQDAAATDPIQQLLVRNALPGSSTEADALKGFESQGISIMAHDNTTRVGNTLDSGQQVELTEAGKLALKQIVQTKNEDGQITDMQSVQEGNVIMVDCQMVVVSQDGAGDGTMMVTVQPVGTIGRPTV